MLTRIGIATVVVLSAQFRAGLAFDSNQPSITHQGRKATLKVNTVRYRPTLLQKLSKLYGWRITYEDAPLSYRGDVVDVTAPTYQSKDDEDRALDAKGGPLDVSFEVPGVGQAPPEAQAAQIIRAILEQYEQLKYPGRYRLEVSDRGVMHVIPFEVKNHDGTPTKVVPVLDTKISLQPQREISGERAIGETTRALGRVTGITILDGGVADNRLSQVNLTFANAPTVARELVDAAAIQSGASNCWLLLYDPGARLYVLNVVH